MLGLGYITRYCGMDATMGMAMVHTGVLFPFFGTTIGWLGVALSGTDAGSNALFGSLQVITANKLGLSPILMGAANSAGGVMGKMVAAQSLVIACAVTGRDGQEGELFAAVLKHSLGLLALVAAFVFGLCFQNLPLTTQGSAWYAGISLTAILLMAAMTFYGFYTSLGGRPIFGGAVLEE